MTITRLSALGWAVLALLHTAMATPTPIISQLQKRKPVLNDSDTISIDDKAPLDAILLIGVALVAALFCLCLAIWNVYVPNHSGSRMIREERARAKTELRLKGGGVGGATSPSPTRMVTEKKPRQHQQSIGTTEIISIDSHSRLVSNSPRTNSDSPKIAQKSSGRPTRASRGYSSYSKYDVAAMTKGEGLETHLSMLAVPTLPTSYSDNASSHSLSSGSASISPPPVPWHARPQYQDRSQSFHSFAGHNRRISTTVGRGTDLNRNRSKKSMSRKIHVNPQAVDPTYSNLGRLSPRTSASDFNDPLSGLELKRYITDPTDSREGSRRNSAMNALDFFNLGGSRGNYTDSATDSNGHEYSGLTHPAPASPSAMTRTRNMAFYDAEQDFGGVAGNRQDSSLLEYGNQASDSSRGGGWRAWGNKI